MCGERRDEGSRTRTVQANGAAEGRFFLGSDVSLVDCMFAPFLERMAASVPYYKGLLVRGNDRLAACVYIGL